MSAEQVLDSLFAAVGKPFRAEELNLDPDGRRPPTEFLNLGVPRRAWQFTLDLERARPPRPVAAGRPEPGRRPRDLRLAGRRGTTRSPSATRRPRRSSPRCWPTASSSTARIARLSDDSAITELCLKDQPADDLIRAVYLRILSRPATEAETARLVAYLGDTYAGRVVPGVGPAPPMRPSARRVSWSNHLHPEATRIQAEEERVVRRGDPPTARLTPAFRERMEDVVWALVNSPEFVFLP